MLPLLRGHRVICFGDPLEALRFLSRHGPADLLFLGLDLPGMDGLAVLKYVKREPSLRETVPIVLLEEEEDGVLARLPAPSTWSRSRWCASRSSRSCPRSLCGSCPQ